ncbi:MAG TPA: GTP 3',8-cyclase MoaA [Planctomycetota bacterium]
MPTLDAYDRPLRSLRVSVTDRCNLRCGYCMPEQEYTWLPRADLLGFEELDRLVGVFAGLGVDRVRLTGGEPLLRRDLPRLVALLAARPQLRDLALTTNALLLADQAAALRAAGLQRLNVSLDTLDRERFRELTRRDELGRALAGIEAAAAAGFRGTKLNTVVMRGINDSELSKLLDFGRAQGLEVRFIEYMDVGGATGWTRERVVSRAEILAAIEAESGPLQALPGQGSAPAARFERADGTRFGIVSSTTAPFCAACDRSRLTADGSWYTCLYAAQGLNLRSPLRAGASDAELAALLSGAWRLRADRGAEERLAAAHRAPLAAAALRADPHLEMHTRGG